MNERGGLIRRQVEMFKIRMQGQYGKGGKRLSEVVGGMWREFGFRKGVMRGYWVGPLSSWAGPLPEASSLWPGLGVLMIPLGDGRS